MDEFIPLNTSQENLPQYIREELAEIVRICKQNEHYCEKILMIWLFGSYARGEEINDVNIRHDGVMTEYQSDLDILVILKNKHNSARRHTRNGLDNKFRKSPLIKRSVHVLIEGLKHFKESLRLQRYWYADILREGIVLLNENNQQFEKSSPLTQDEQWNEAVFHYEKHANHVTSAKNGFGFYYQSEEYPAAIHTLHQLTERLTSIYLLVFTNYLPRTHDLIDLTRRMGVIDTQIKNIFPQKGEEDFKLFVLLNRAYVDARYEPNYHIEPEKIDVMMEWVAEFHRWVIPECLAKIDNIWPEKAYSKSCEPPGAYLDPVQVKTTELPIVRAKNAERREEAERKAKEEGLEREALKDKALKKERKEKERLRELLHKAGVDPGTDS
ncbi:MAG: HEPN domain-containing protein [Pseudomonadales bacterium]